MKSKKIIKLINEELNEFDFLNQEENKKHEKTIDVIKKEEFQKQFIVDVALHPKKLEVDVIESKIEIADAENEDHYNIDYNSKIEYELDSENKIGLQLVIKGDGDSININPDKYGVELFSEFGDEVQFKEYKKAPDNIKKIFLKEFIGELYDNLESNDVVRIH